MYALAGRKHNLIIDQEKFVRRQYKNQTVFCIMQYTVHNIIAKKGHRDVKLLRWRTVFVVQHKLPEVRTHVV